MSTNSDRLAFYLPSLCGGGAERVTVNLLRCLAQMGQSLDLVLVKADGPYLKDVPSSVRVIDLQGTRVITSIPRLVKYLNQERPKALVSALFHANIAALLARRLAGGDTKLAVVNHSTLSKVSAHGKARYMRLIKYLVGKCYHWADGVAAVSQGVADDLAQVTGLSRETIQVLYNPVVREEIFTQSREVVSHPWLSDLELKGAQVPLIIAVGRLSRPKAFDILIQAFALVKKQRDARLLILGEGEERLALEALIQTAGLGDCVLLPGFVANPYAYLARAQLFVLSSRWEGLPTVLVEALALGIPVVSTDCESGPREILGHGKYGRLSPVEDPAALAEAMLASLERPHAMASPEAWAAFTENTAAENYLRYIRRLECRTSPG